jgi:hypothetical protein
MGDAKSGLIHLEYTVAPDGSLEYLKVWSCVTRGRWLLACEYWVASSTFHEKGIHFENGFQSTGLTRTLEFIMQHQQAFSPSLNLGRTSLVQIHVPTELEGKNAATLVRDAFCRVNSFSAESSVA